jgi:hypothetical protein
VTAADRLAANPVCALGASLSSRDSHAVDQPVTPMTDSVSMMRKLGVTQIGCTNAPQRVWQQLRSDLPEFGYNATLQHAPWYQAVHSNRTSMPPSYLPTLPRGPTPNKIIKQVAPVCTCSPQIHASGWMHALRGHCGSSTSLTRCYDKSSSAMGAVQVCSAVGAGHEVASQPDSQSD